MKLTEAIGTMMRQWRLLVVAAALIAVGQQRAVQADKAAPSAPLSNIIVLQDGEQREMQASLDSRLARERDYQAALVSAQLAQARFEAANSAAEAKFYKLCAKYKVDPDVYEFTPDARGLRPRVPAAQVPAEGKK